MSVQFGKCHLDGKPLDPKDLDQVRPVLAPYGPDGEGYICKDNFGIIYRAFHTTKESGKERQPHLSPSGFVLTWDGRLDNREDLVGELRNDVSQHSTDLDIVAAAYRRMGTNAFAKLIGDWALSIWHPRDHLLLLAKDFVGTRHLYYTIEKDQVTWCSILEPLALFGGRPLALEEEYIAGWLASFPATHLTPYVGIHSVPPSSFVSSARGTQMVSKYWDFNRARSIRYRTDAEYEEHFRAVFRAAIRRRLRSANAVLAELSGGMDSSSIVCVADNIIATNQIETVRLDTVSYYDDSEPNWDERPYFKAVEVYRSQSGEHIDVSRQRYFNFEEQSGRVAATPDHVHCGSEASRQFATSLVSRGNRTVLSGIGGDEFMGGVPSVYPELADLLARARFVEFLHQLEAWALTKRKPCLYLFLGSLRGFLPLAISGVSDQIQPPPWLDTHFADKHRAAFAGYPSRLKLFGPLPTFQENVSTLDNLRRQLSCSILPVQPTYEKRYPYLDRDLLEFIFAIPREQLLRPGQRRSLMRRALRGIVPDLVLQRRRKAFVSRGPRVGLATEWPAIIELTDQMCTAEAKIVDRNLFREALRKARQGEEGVPHISVIRTLALEFWLRRLVEPKFMARPLQLPCCIAGVQANSASTSVAP